MTKLPAQDDLHRRWQRAIVLFNDREFYACHDVLEEIWHDAPYDDRDFYKGVLQIAVGFYHLERQNNNGAMVLMGTGISNLRKFHPDHQGLDVSALVTATHQIWQNLGNHQLPPQLPKLVLTTRLRSEEN